MERPQAIRFGRLNNGIYRCAGIGAMRRVAKQPVFPSDGKGTHRTLRPVIRQFQPSVQKYIHQPVSLVQGISQRRTKHTFWYGIFLLFLSHLGKKFFRHRSGAFHPGGKPFLKRKSLFCVIFFQMEQLIAVLQTDLNWRACPDILRKRFQCIREFSPHMCPAARNCDLLWQFAVVCLIPICMQQPSEALQKIACTHSGPAGLVIVQHHRPYRIAGCPIYPHITLLPGLPAILP